MGRLRATFDGLLSGEDLTGPRRLQELRAMARIYDLPEAEAERPEDVWRAVRPLLEKEMTR